MESVTRTPPAASGQTASWAAQDAALAAIVRSSQDAVIAKTVDGIITEWNLGAAAIYGHPAESMIGRHIEVTIPPEYLDEERDRHARVAAGNAESGYHCTRLKADSEPIEVIMSMSPVRDSTGQVFGVASISRPVNESERNEHRFAALLAAAPDAIVCVDREGRIAAINAQVTELFGYDGTELLGQKVEMLLPEEFRADHLQHRAKFMSSPQTRSMGAGLALSGRRKDGSVFPVEVSLAPDPTGPESLAIAAIRDVTEQRAGQAAVLESESRLRQLAESVNIVFLLRQIDPPRYLYVSPGARTVLGREPAELMEAGDIGLDLLHPDDRERVGRDYLRLTERGEAARSEHRILLPDGRARWVRSTATPVPNGDGIPERDVVTVEDITERVEAADALRKAEAAARAANEAKNQFLSRMSHELRTPLNAVLGFGQLLARSLANTEHAEAVGHILKGGRHLLDLINDVLDIARIESGDMSISTEPVPLAAIVEETIQLMQPLADAANVVLQLQPATSDQFVLADRQRLRQVLLNLLSNAIKYNSSGGRVEVGWNAADDHVVIFVRDDGPGIAAELQARLFTPFDRLGAEASGIDGAGIGLALTRSLVERMNGAIAVRSARGEGSEFTVTLPATELRVDVDARINAAESTVPQGIPAARSLLYIEDNAPNVRVIEHLLRMRPGWHMVHAALGHLGLELAEAHRPDLILLDLHLPDLSGHDVLTALKSSRALKNTPVVILTADASPGQARRLIETGAAGYLTKPLDLDEVLAAIDAVAVGEPVRTR